MENKSDAELSRDCLQGEAAAYEELLRRYRNRIYGYLLRLAENPEDAEDLAQETFVRAFSRLDSYKPQYPFSSWLFRIAHNRCMDFLRARERPCLPLEGEDGALELPEPGPAPEQMLQDNLQEEDIERLLAALPVAYREVVLLRYKEDMSCAETADALGLPEGTVKIRLFRARELLLGKLAAFGLSAPRVAKI